MRQGRGVAAPHPARRTAGRTAADARKGAGAGRHDDRSAARAFATIGSRRTLAGDRKPRIARADRPDPIQSTRLKIRRMKTLFFDIDSQLDFLYPAGALYVPGAERVVSAIARLNRHAAAHGIPVISTV